MLIRGAPGSGPALPELHGRLRWVVVVVVVAFAALVGRLWQLQVVRGDEYYESTLDNVVDRKILPSIRGKILDRNGSALANNRPGFNIYALPPFDSRSEQALVRLLGLSDEELELLKKRLREGRARDARIPVLILDDQSSERAGLIEQARFQIPGLEVRNEPHRFYPFGDLAAHVLGYMNHLTPSEAKRLRERGYDDNELIGRDGLEREWENYLRGKKGQEKYVRNARGERIEGAEARRLIEGEALVTPKAGHDLVLTLDLELQKLAEEAVSEHAAAAVAVVEVDTGRVMALVSKPSYDPNVMTGRLSRAEKALLDADPRKPFLDKTLQVHYPPGSTYKFVTAVAALEDGIIGDEEPQSCPGYYQLGRRTSRCTSSHGKISMAEAIQRSCNVFLWKLSERVGIDRMAEVAVDFGFGAPTGLGLNGDVPGRVPTRAWYEQRTTFKVGYTSNAAVGQGDVEVTVMQLVMAYAAMANGGTLYVPQLVRRVQTAAGETVIDIEPKVRRTVRISPDTLELLRHGMWRAVNRPGGTAHEHAHSELVEYAGKTGTAQVRNRRVKEDGTLRGWLPHRDHAWFAGYAPHDEPEIAVVVLIEHGGPGGKVAAPVARDIIEGYFSRVKSGGAPARESADDDELEAP